jgi:hypothetical protein
MLQGPESMNNRSSTSLKCLRPAVKIFVLGWGGTNLLVLLNFAQCNMIYFAPAAIGWLGYNRRRQHGNRGSTIGGKLKS